MHRARRYARTLSATVIVIALPLMPGSAWADDVKVTPSTKGMPAGKTIQVMLSWVAQAALFASLGSILVGAAVWGLSKLMGSYSGGHKGLTLTIGGCVGAMIVGLAPQLINMFFKAS